ncbi:hypothetical protein M2336_001036 [Sphingobium sp. B1D7B]|uniref:hypothetical protein n=1 Tax=Sphingobium sp. B1D7B TaxID=2940578 RepID=UPI002223F3AC|nr:hypothetical protein [Sphingobium sp. B1D7B]MCW2404407.1 hypothetical protein [Sphingobium sp. B1D7B]
MFRKLVIGFLATILTPQVANAAPVTTSFGTITQIGGGWVGAFLSVQLSIPIVNPDGCTYAGTYMTDPTMGGSQLFNSILLSAYMGGKQVSLVIDGCMDGFPKIIAVYSH